ncbi:hypothetical protein GQ44DRAFT_764587 [Phaeosphaeriaceae sp. PMI808]|nr:hypothetical protein GQ44DRAFT_764587 [Phaeosphaeriaceae sp. PMI808]
MPEITTSSNLHDAVDPYTESPGNSLLPQDVHAQLSTLDDHESPKSVSCQGDAPSGKGNLTMPTRDVLDGFLSFFFQVLYPMPSYAFLHPRTTKRRCYSKKNSCSLSLALCSVASVHMKDQSGGAIMSTPHAKIQERATAWVRAAEQSIWLQLEHPSISRLQTLLLIIHYHMETAHFQRAFMLIATAARYAAAMGLNHERQHCDRIAQEVGRRILWSLKIVERYFSVGLAEFDMLPLEVIYIEFPQREEEFLDSELDQQSLQGKGENGAYRLLIQLEVVRRDIMRLTRNITLLEEPLANLAELVDHHRRMIAGVEVPPPLSQSCGSMGSEDTFEDHWLPRHVLAHISWHQTHCDLYRILLPGYSEAAPSTVLRGYDASELARAEDLCSHHAMRIINIITTLNQHSDRRHLLEFDTAICAYHATRLVLYISRLGNRRNRLSPEFALSRAQLCLAALKRFFFASALVAPIIRELEQSIHVFSTQQQQIQQGRASSSAIISQQYSNGPSPQSNATATNGSHDLTESDGKNISNQCTDGGQGRHLSSAAQARQRLAIHSLLRRADFADDDEEEEEAHAGQHDLTTSAPQGGGNPSRAADYERVNPITRPPMNICQGETQQHGQVDTEPDLNGHSPASAIISTMATGQDILSSRQYDPNNTADSNPLISSNLTEPGEQAQLAASTVASPITLDTTTPSTASDQDMVGMMMRNRAWDAEDIEPSIFSWWGSQDWGWLSDVSGKPMS